MDSSTTEALDVIASRITQSRQQAQNLLQNATAMSREVEAQRAAAGDLNAQADRLEAGLEALTGLTTSKEGA